MMEPLSDALDVDDSPGNVPAGVNLSQASALPRHERVAASPQHRMLADLTKLIRRCADEQRELERTRRNALEQCDAELHKALAAVEQQAAQERQAAEAERDAQLADIQSRMERRRAEIQEVAAAERHHHQSQHQSLERTAQQEYEQEKWLADSVLEVNQSRVRAEAATARKELDDKLRALEQVVTQGAALMRRYGVSGIQTNHHASTGTTGNDPAGTFAARCESAQTNLSHMRRMILPRLFVGITPWLLVVLLCLSAAAAAQWWSGGMSLSTPTFTHTAWRPIAYATAVMAACMLIAGVLVRRAARSRLQQVNETLVRNAAEARHSARQQADVIDETERRHADAAARTHHNDVKRVKDRNIPSITQSRRTHGAAVADIDSQQQHQLESARTEAAHETEQIRNQYRQRIHQVDEQQAADNKAAHADDEARRHQLDTDYRQHHATILHALTEGAANSASLDKTGSSALNADWSDSSWRHWTPPATFPAGIRFGHLAVDPKRIALSSHDPSAGDIADALPWPKAFSVPALLTFPDEASLFIHHGSDQRHHALAALQQIMTRLLTQLPPGRVRFTLIDPVGLGQNFAGFMHLADYEDALVGGRIWTESAQIEQRLADLTEHMETVIQKYLRNEYPTIDQYNRQAGELAEPYRFLVIADFPSAFSDESLRRLTAIASSGARCGVHTLIACDRRQSVSGSILDDLSSRGVFLSDDETHHVTGRTGLSPFIWKQDVFEQFPLAIDPPPDEKTLTKLMEQVGRAARNARRVEVPFDAITPSSSEVWTRDAADGISVPIGRSGATRLQAFRLGQGMAQHALVAGKTGSGKSTLLHALITNLSLWYSPDHVELYLIDFKRGVEFKTYCTHALPHARAIAVESDREFALSVLQRLDGELARRGELFRNAGTQDLPAYLMGKSGNHAALPRVLLIIDEFQEFFSEDDRIAQEAALLLDRLVRQGRAFGMHVLLGSQTISGASALSRSTLGQMAVRIALQTSEADSQLILGDNNSAARLLDRPGEAIYNDAGGLIEANSPFQVAWLGDSQREQQLSRVSGMAAQSHSMWPAPVIFEGNVPADITRNKLLAELLHSKPKTPPTLAQAYVGEPVAIRPPTAIPLRRLSGANLLIIGQNDRTALAMLSATMVSLAAQHPADDAQFRIFDATAADSPLAGWFEQLTDTIPHQTITVPWRQTTSAINELAAELRNRMADESSRHPSVYIILNGLQRYRLLRKSEETFSFSADTDEKPADPAQQFADLLREGPPVGIHILCWCDTPASLERTLDRNALREFDHRILLQMSVTDSSNLMDSPAANKLGLNRALSYSEEMGTIEKFRPYDLPPSQWLTQVKQWLEARG